MLCVCLHVNVCINISVCGSPSSHSAALFKWQSRQLANSGLSRPHWPQLVNVHIDTNWAHPHPSLKCQMAQTWASGVIVYSDSPILKSSGQFIPACVSQSATFCWNHEFQFPESPRCLHTSVFLFCSYTPMPCLLLVLTLNLGKRIHSGNIWWKLRSYLNVV